MASLASRWKGHIDKQFSRPTGIIGQAVGRRMVRQHEPEIHWTISQLDVQPTDRVLEIGFGAGRAIELLVPTCEHVSGIDLSQTMVSAARRRNAQAIRAGKVDIRRGDVSTLPFGDAQFDKIFSVHSLYFWPDYSRAIAEIARVLKPHGKVVLTLTPGQVNVDGTKEVWPIQSTLEERVLPDMRQMGFTSVYLKDGPNSRQFLTVAVIGEYL